MRFGIFQSAQWPEGTSQLERLREAVEQSVFAEQIGFDSVFMTEHHFSRHGIVPDNLVMLSYLAAQTRRIRLGTAVSVLPLHDPMRLAESAALLDVLSGGRLELGIGRGYQWGEFNGFGLSLADRAARFDESISVILRVWTDDEPFTHEGRFWHYRDVVPQPRPLQRPHPPIWMATVSDDGFDRCIDHGWGVMLPQGVPLDVVERWVAAYKSAHARRGIDYDPGRLMLARGLYAGADDATAWREAGGAYEEFIDLAQKVAASPEGGASPVPFTSEGIRESALIAGPRTCAEKLRAIRALGIEHVIFFGNMGGLAHARVMDSMRRFAQHVMPEFREA